MPPAGSLNHLVTLQVKDSTTRNSFGEYVETWTDLWWDYAAFETVGTREFPEAQKRHAETTARFRMGYRTIPKLDPAKHRLVMTFDRDASPPDLSTWNIHGISKKDRFELLIEASEIL